MRWEAPARLHARETVRSSLNDSVYASTDLAKAAPKYRFPKDEWRSEDAYAVRRHELLLDGNSRQNLANVLPDVAGTPSTSWDGPWRSTRT